MKKKTKIYLGILTLSIFFLSIGYASISNISLDLTGEIVATATKGVHITDISLDSSTDSTHVIKSFSKTVLNTGVTLNSSDAYVTYEITFYNNSNYDYYFRKVIYDEEFYDNTDITFTLEGLDPSTVIKSKNSLTAKITFKFKDGVVDNKTLNAVLNFSFSNSSTVMKDKILNNFVEDGDIEKLPSISINDMDDDERKTMFSTPAGSEDTGLFKTTGLYGEETLVFRGNVSNNYVKFGTYLWRILQIDEDGNLRLILNGSIGKYRYNSTSTINSLDEAPNTLGYPNSIIKYNLDNWYNSLTGYTDKVVTSRFCMNYDYITMTSSGSGNKVYYFQSYQNVGPDSGVYNPSFSCPLDSIYEDKIGLLTAEEYVMAGGAFNKNTTNTAVNYDGFTTYYWTLSPAFYDIARKNGGVFIISADGNLTDWSMSLLGSYFETRPIITINGNIEMSGSGTITDPYQYTDSLSTASKIDITDLSSLNNNKFFIGHINSPKKKMYGVLSSIRKKSGYIGADTAYFNANKDKITITIAEEMLFSDGVETTDGYLYKITNAAGEYLRLNDDKGIDFTTDETTLKVKLVTDEDYPGQIIITNEDESMYLNFYGSESGNGDDFFAGWDSEDFNAYFTLYKLDEE